jgi:hypothetical protein
VPRFLKASWNVRDAWWNRKRCGVVAMLLLIWLSIGIPLLVGPIDYCGQRRWITLATLNAVHRPIRESMPDFAEPYHEVYCQWWIDLATRHDADMRLRRDHPELFR